MMTSRRPGRLTFAQEKSARCLHKVDACFCKLVRALRSFHSNASAIASSSEYRLQWLDVAGQPPGVRSGGLYDYLKQLARLSPVLDRVAAGSPDLGKEAVALRLHGDIGIRLIGSKQA